jgi:predicted secreted acid phosphatase
LRNERPEWAASDKTVRRAHVARTHRILLLIGDDLGDFVPADGTSAQRDARLEPHAAAWGTRWIVIPNPMYGSWERAVLASQPGAGPLEKKAAALQPRR